MKLKIFQIHNDSRNLAFMNHKFTESHGGVDPKNYRCVFKGYMEANDLDDIYATLNQEERPGTFRGHSLSVSDVVEVMENTPNWYAFETNNHFGEPYSLARLQICKAMLEALRFDMNYFDGRIVDPLSDSVFEEFNDLGKRIPYPEQKVDTEEIKAYLLPLAMEFSARIPTWYLEAMGWEQKNVMESIADHLLSDEMREHLRKELSADDIAICTEASEVCREVKAVREKSMDLTDCKYVPIIKAGAYFVDSVGYQQIDFDDSLAEEQEGLRCVEIQPGYPAFESRLVDKLEELQRSVSKHSEEALIEFTYPFEGDSAILLGNEEAKLIGMEGNRRIEGSVYAGPLFVIGDDGEGGLCDLTDEQVQKYSEMFATPETISQEEVQSDLGFSIYGW